MKFIASSVPTWRVSAAVLVMVAALLCLRPVFAQDGQTLIFRSKVELVVVDAQVTSHDGNPIPGLTPPDFAVTIDNHQRRVVSVDLIETKTSDLASSAPDAPGPVIRTPGEIKEGTRVYIIAVDESSFSMSAIRPAMQAAQRFVDHLQPNDLVGVYDFPFGGHQMDLTHERAAVKIALGKLMGRQERPRTQGHLGLAEIVDISAGDTSVLNAAATRECPPQSPAFDVCKQLMQGDAFQIGSYYENVAQQSIDGLGRLLNNLAWIPGRKTVVYVSGGLIAADRPGGRPDVALMMHDAGKQVAGSDTNLYVLHLDDSLADPFSAGNESTPDPSVRFTQAGRDHFVLGSGLDQFAGYANGALLRVMAGTGDVAFNRILRETAAYYLLGIEPVAADRDGKQHAIRVKVNAKGTTIRNRTQVMIPKG
jgi:VWFA-related protein